ncbi:MAG TPA: choice-of-anchor B family protein [Herpetosiphonaceae bacterium]
MRRWNIRGRGLILLWLAALAGAGLVGRPAGLALAHSAKGGAVYVAPTGRDYGHCDNAARPCQTIRYAIDHVPHKNIEVRVAAGEYPFEPAETLLLLGSLITVKGGYSAAEGFAVQDPARNLTILVGPSASYRAQLRARGFALKQDLDGLADIPLPPERPQPATARVTCVNGMAGLYPCKGIDLMAHVPLAQLGVGNTEASNIWGFVDKNDNREYAVIGLDRGTAVVEVTNPEAPRVVGTVAATNTSSWRELKIYQVFDQQQNRWKAYAYVVSDVVGSPGIQIIDLTALPTSVSLAATYSGISQQHTVYLSNADYSTGAALPGATPYLYVNGGSARNGAFQAFSLANPTAIAPASTPASGAEYTHDGTSMLITDARVSACRTGHNPCEVYVDFNEDSVDIWDMTDKASPLRISSTPYQGSGYTHSGWWTEDKRYVFIQDEFDEIDFGHNSRVRTMDLSDLRNPTITVSWTGSTPAIDHNGYTKRGLYYMSSYRRGLVILDVSNPQALEEVAFFDTFPQDNDANFNGAWGTYPFFPSGTIVVSDIESGLFILRESPQAITGLVAIGASPVTVGQTVAFSATVATGTGVTYAWQFGDQGSGTGAAPTHQYGAPGVYTATVTASNGLTTKTATVAITVRGDGGQRLYLPQVLKDGRSAGGAAAPIVVMTLLLGLGARSWRRRRE